MKAFHLTTLMYHYVREAGDAAEAGSGIAGLPTTRFEAQLDYLAQHYDLIAWPDLQAYLLDRKPLPPRACLLTFDDGICDHYLNVFPALARRRLSGLFFAMAGREGSGLTMPHRIHFLLAALGLDGLREAIRAQLSEGQRERLTICETRYRMQWRDPVDAFKSVLQRNLSVVVDPILGQLYEQHLGSEREMAERYYLSRTQIQEMSAGGMHFGGHSETHPWFDWISPEALQREIVASAVWLRATEPGPWAFAYPYGGLNDAAPPLFDVYGFAAAFTTRDQSAHTNRFYIGRFDGEEIKLNGAHINQPEGAPNG